MKVNQKILCIPPYISTAWKNVTSLHLNRDEGCPLLIIGLVNGSKIEIPNLEIGELEVIFNAHEKFLELESLNPPAPQREQVPPTFLQEINVDNAASLLSMPLRFGIDGNNMGNLIQHNSEASDSPDLPKEVLEKIATLSKVIGFENSENFPKPEPHCNCMHCQIMRVIRQEEENTQDQMEEEEVLDKDLKFRDWDINQTNEKLFIVSNPLNEAERYNVFLGSPVGCTCGLPNCEHIRAVLNS